MVGRDGVWVAIAAAEGGLGSIGRVVSTAETVKASSLKPEARNAALHCVLGTSSPLFQEDLHGLGIQLLASTFHCAPAHFKSLVCTVGEFHELGVGVVLAVTGYALHVKNYGRLVG